MIRIRQVSRRGFLGSVFSAGALVLGGRVASAQISDKPTWMPSVYLGIEPDGTVITVAHRSEMGTGSRTALPMVIADELGADWSKVRIEQAIGDKKYGSQNTDGSCSIRDFYAILREAGATGRLMLERAAAAQWKVPAGECRADNHFVVHTPSGRKLAFGALVADAQKLPLPKKEEIVLRKPEEFRFIGKGVPIVDEKDLVSGKGIFGQDVSRPGMLYASIERPPVYGGTLKSFDDAEAKKVSGVARTIALPGWKPPHGFQQLGGVAVLANNTWAAQQGRQKLKVEWNSGPHATFDSTRYKQTLLATVRQPQKVVRNFGDVDAAMSKAAKTHEAEYYVPLLAHAAMEPPAAVAEFKDGKAEVWTCTQNPQAVQDTVAAALGIKAEDVTCHVTLLGGGFGRKSKPDYVAEAALLARETSKPVKVVWSREDDLRFDFYHSVAGMYIKAALDDQGLPTAWLHRTAFPSIGSTFNNSEKYAADFELGMGWNELPFAVQHHRAENGPAEHHVRIGWLRSVAHIYHAFAIHTFLDELAAMANRDRVEYILAAIGPDRQMDFADRGGKIWNNGQPLSKFPWDTARLKRVVQLAAEKSDWGKKKSGPGHAWGIAAHRSFLSYVATVVEVEVDSQGRVRIPRVDMAVDAGQIIHPDRVKAQFEGAAVFGTSIAMMGEITAADGRIQQSNFHNYPVARMQEAPYQTHVHLVNSRELPAGVGEPGVPPMVPALCNAIYAATGKRVRDLPVRKQKLV